MEFWKTVNGFERYEVSNYGRIKSPIKILKGTANNHGYLVVCLTRHPLRPLTKSIHTIVWDAFGKTARNGHILQIDHRDNDKANNHIDNLQLLSNRENSTKDIPKDSTTSKYLGVTNHYKDKWKAMITIGKQYIYLGTYDNEYDAHQAYQNKLKEIV